MEQNILSLKLYCAMSLSPYIKVGIKREKSNTYVPKLGVL